MNIIVLLLLLCNSGTFPVWEQQSPKRRSDIIPIHISYVIFNLIILKDQLIYNGIGYNQRIVYSSAYRSRVACDNVFLTGCLDIHTLEAYRTTNAKGCFVIHQCRFLEFNDRIADRCFQRVDRSTECEIHFVTTPSAVTEQCWHYFC
jgi:hypothetical protein